MTGCTCGLCVPLEPEPSLVRTSVITLEQRETTIARGFGLRHRQRRAALEEGLFAALTVGDRQGVSELRVALAEATA